MKIKIIIIILSIIYHFQVIGQQRTQSNPYCRFNDIQKENLYGYEPGPAYIHFNQLPEEFTTDLPYYDLRQNGLVSPVRNKGGCGCCYAFAAMAVIESYWLKNGWGLTDFSEEHLRSCNGFVNGPELSCSGGDIFKVYAYLSRHDGPVSESQLPYTGISNILCNQNVSIDFHHNQLRLLPPVKSVIKQAILENGAIYTAMYYSDQYFRASDNTYYYPGTATENHAVTIAGWDDNKITAGGTGAWIIKNDFGSTWGDNGYFYISYNDTRILSSNGYFPDRTHANATALIYMYDKLGFNSSTGWNDETAYGLVKFTSYGQWPVRRIGTFVNTAGSQIDITLYDHFSQNQLSGKLAELKGLNCQYPGYYVFDLPFPVMIFAGNDFFVHIKYHTPGYNNPVPTEKTITGYANPEIETGKCWISHYGTQWTALGSNAQLSIDKIDLCIRAYAMPYPLEISNIESQFNIYPNPASSILYIELPINECNAKIEIFNLAGICLYKKSVNQNMIEINLGQNNFKSGVYLVKVSLPSGIYCRGFAVN